MFHSITFTHRSEDELNAGGFTKTSTGLLLNGINTWDEWHLIPSSRPDIAMPGISEKYLEIPGRDGSIDLSEWLAGRITYGDREGSLEFYHQNGYEDYETVRRAMAHYFHGRTLKMILEDDPGYYYEGRFRLNGWKSDASHSKVVIDYRLRPYKWDILSRVRPTDWPFDAFGFERDSDYWFTVPDFKTSGTVTYKNGQFVKHEYSIYRFTEDYSGSSANALDSAVLVPNYMEGTVYSVGDYAVYNGSIHIKTASGWETVPESFFYWHDVPTYSSQGSYKPGEIVIYENALQCFTQPSDPESLISIFDISGNAPLVGEIIVKGYRVIRPHIHFSGNGFISAENNKNYDMGSEVKPTFFCSTGEMNDQFRLFIIGTPNDFVFRGGQL